MHLLFSLLLLPVWQVHFKVIILFNIDYFYKKHTALSKF
jgi:hypothetical protein